MTIWIEEYTDRSQPRIAGPHQPGIASRQRGAAGIGDFAGSLARRRRTTVRPRPSASDASIWVSILDSYWTNAVDAALEWINFLQILMELLQQLVALERR